MYFHVNNTDKAAPETVTGVPYDKLTIGIPKEIHEGERRVALSPEAAKQLTKEGFKVIVETGAGAGAKFLDSDYIAAGAEVKTVKDALGSDIVFKVCDKTNSVTDSCSLLLILIFLAGLSKKAGSWLEDKKTLRNSVSNINKKPAYLVYDLLYTQLLILSLIWE